MQMQTDFVAICTQESNTAPDRRQEHSNNTIQLLYYQNGVQSLSNEVLSALTGQNAPCVSSKQDGPFTDHFGPDGNISGQHKRCIPLHIREYT